MPATINIFNTDRTFLAAFNNCGKCGIEALVDPSMTRAELVENIRKGEFGFDNVVKVIAFNPVEHIADDISEEIFAEVDAAAQRIKDSEDFPRTAAAMEAAE